MAASRRPPASSTSDSAVPIAGADARPRRRHRLRAVHHLPPPHAAVRGDATPRVRRAAPSAPPAARSSSPALTVVIALAALAVVGIPFLTAMGLAAAVTVAVAVLVALTLLPALLGFAGLRVWPKGKNFEHRARAPAKPTLGARWVGLSSRASRVPARGRCRSLALGALRDPRRSTCASACPTTATAAPHDHPAQGLRPARRRLRPGLQRPADDRGRRARRRRRREAAARRSRRSSGARRRRRRRARRCSTRAGDTAILIVIPSSGPSTRGDEGPRRATIRDRTGALEASHRRRASLVTGQTAAHHRHLRASWPARCCPTSPSSSGSRSCC